MNPEKILNPYTKYTLPEPKTGIEWLERELCRLHSEWVRTKDPRCVEDYHVAYFLLREAGWDGGIDVDTELPEEHMPAEYLRKTGR